MRYNAFFRLYEELNDYLPPERRKATFSLTIKGSTTIKGAISSLGVPTEEVDLVLVNGESAPFDHIIAEGDMISIYPIFESLDISNVTSLRDKPLIKLVQDLKKPKSRKELKMARKKIDESIRQKVMEAHARGLPMRKIAKEYGVSLSSVSRIVKEKGPQEVQKAKTKKMDEAERKKKIAELEKKIAELEKKILEIESKYR